MDLNRFMGSLREREGSSHRRQKSRDKSSDTKVLLPKNSVFLVSTHMADKSILLGPSGISISASFPNANGKGQGDVATTFSTVYAIITDVRTLFTTQTRHIPSNGIASLFKPDPQKKLDKEQSLKVCTPRTLQSNCAKWPRFKHLSSNFMIEGTRG